MQNSQVETADYKAGYQAGYAVADRRIEVLTAASIQTERLLVKLVGVLKLVGAVETYLDAQWSWPPAITDALDTVQAHLEPTYPTIEGTFEEIAHV